MPRLNCRDRVLNLVFKVASVVLKSVGGVMQVNTFVTNVAKIYCHMKKCTPVSLLLRILITKFVDLATILLAWTSDFPDSVTSSFALLY